MAAQPRQRVRATRDGQARVTRAPHRRVVWDDRSLEPEMLSASDEQVYDLLGVPLPQPDARADDSAPAAGDGRAADVAAPVTPRA
jgi:hypothetical protein